MALIAKTFENYAATFLPPAFGHPVGHSREGLVTSGALVVALEAAASFGAMVLALIYVIRAASEVIVFLGGSALEATGRTRPSHDPHKRPIFTEGRS